MDCLTPPLLPNYLSHLIREVPSCPILQLRKTEVKQFAGDRQGGSCRRLRTGFAQGLDSSPPSGWRLRNTYSLPPSRVGRRGAAGMPDGFWSTTRPSTAGKVLSKGTRSSSQSARPARRPLRTGFRRRGSPPRKTPRVLRAVAGPRGRRPLSHLVLTVQFSQESLRC